MGLEVPKVEVRFKDLNISADVQTGSRALPTLVNFTRDMIEVLSYTYLHFFIFIRVVFVDHGPPSLAFVLTANPHYIEDISTEEVPTDYLGQCQRCNQARKVRLSCLMTTIISCSELRIEAFFSPL